MKILDKTKKLKMKEKMTKKIKICTVVIAVIAVILMTLLAPMLINTFHCIPIKAPDAIIVYHNSGANNVVLEKSADAYDKIYKQLIASYNQNMIKAFFKGDLSKKPKISTHNIEEIDYAGITIEFVYNAPQILQNKRFKQNGKIYWYQALVFKTSSTNKYQYNTVAIISPSDSHDYISPYHYTVSCQSYSNSSKLHKTAINLFK